MPMLPTCTVFVKVIPRVISHSEDSLLVAKLRREGVAHLRGIVNMNPGADAELASKVAVYGRFAELPVTLAAGYL